MRTTTFRLGEHGRAAVDALTELGFAFEPSRNTTITLLDTFDGRFHRAGLRLQLDESEHATLELTGESTVPAHVTVETVPQVPADLPPGPFRSRVAKLAGTRALVPRLRLTALRTSGAWRDAAGKVVAIADVYETHRIADRPDLECPDATIEIREVTGYREQARRSVEVLRALGTARCETDTLTQCAAAADVDLAGFRVSATVPLDPEMAAIDGVRLVLDNLVTAMRANWQGTIDQTDAEFLHQLRIAVRRTRTVLGVSNGVLPAEIRRSAREGFAWLAGLTSTPRDLDVYLLEWSHYTDPLGAETAPSLDPVRELLERRRAEAHQELERGLRSERASDLIQTWQAWLVEPLTSDDRPRRADHQLGPLVAKRVSHAHSRLIERGRLIDSDTPAERVHDLRKNAKELRYLVECFGSLFRKADRKPYVKRLAALQDNLGEHQDAEVHIGMLRDVANELHTAGVPADTIVAIGRLTQLLEQQRHAARTEYAERFADYERTASRRAFHALLDGITS